MRARRVVACIVALLLALPIAAEPADGASSWWSWLAEGWQSVVRLVAGSEEPAEEPEAEVPAPEDALIIVCLPLVGCVEVDDDGGPGMDPDG